MERVRLARAEDNILEVKNLNKRFDGFALKDISFSLPCGYIMGFIGANGAGKSTTIKLLINLLHRDGGKISFFGQELLESEKEIKDRIGVVFDESHFYEEITLADNERIVAPFYSRWDHAQFIRYLKRFDLDPKQKLKKLSKGMKMKFALATALAHEAELLIMDEPTGGLDPVFRNELLEILAEFIQDGQRSVLFSTHITSDLDKTADFITFIHEGEIVFSAAKDDILEQYALVKGDTNLLTPELQPLFVGLRRSPFGFEGLVRDRQEALRRLREQALFEKPSLEDIMLYTVRREQRA